MLENNSKNEDVFSSIHYYSNLILLLKTIMTLKNMQPASYLAK